MFLIDYVLTKTDQSTLDSNFAHHKFIIMAKYVLLKVHELIVYFLQSFYHVINTLYFDIYKSNLRNNAIGGLVRMDLSYLCNSRKCRILTIATVNCGLFYMVKTILIKGMTSIVHNILFSTLCILFLLSWIWISRWQTFINISGQYLT